MRARVPLDVDLEDRLVFGLSPQRFGYIAVAALAALACWHALPWVGGPLALLVLTVGAAFGWARWRGRGLDHWAVASVLWVARTRRLEFNPRFHFLVVARVRALDWPVRPRSRAPAPSLPRILRTPPTPRRLRVVRGVESDP